MSGHRPFSDLMKDIGPKERKRIDRKKDELRSEMALADLRRARKLTQDALGQTLDVQQPAIAKMEKRTDMYVSNLRAFIEAMGGQLKITAEFPEGNVVISNFADVGVNEDAQGADR